MYNVQVYCVAFCVDISPLHVSGHGTHREAGLLCKAQDPESEILRVFMCVTLDFVSVSLVFSLPICGMEDNFFHAKHKFVVKN